MEICRDKKGFYLISEFCKGGELFDRLLAMKSGFTEKDAAHIMKQLLSAIAYLHSKNICHKDLKLENILLNFNDKLSIKVIDFGCSSFFDPEKLMTEVFGTPYYVAPEAVKDRKFNEKCDIWSAGVILYVLLSGRLPFKGINTNDTLTKVCRGKFEFQGKGFSMFKNAR